MLSPMFDSCSPLRAHPGPAENSDEEDEKEDERRAKRFAKRAKMNIFLAKGAVDDTNSASRFFDDEESQSMLGLFKVSFHLVTHHMVTAAFIYAFILIFGGEGG